MPDSDLKSNMKFWERDKKRIYGQKIMGKPESMKMRFLGQLPNLMKIMSAHVGNGKHGMKIRSTLGEYLSTKKSRKKTFLYYL